MISDYCLPYCFYFINCTVFYHKEQYIPIYRRLWGKWFFFKLISCLRWTFDCKRNMTFNLLTPSFYSSNQITHALCQCHNWNSTVTWCVLRYDGFGRTTRYYDSRITHVDNQSEVKHNLSVRSNVPGNGSPILFLSRGKPFWFQLDTHGWTGGKMRTADLVCVRLAGVCCSTLFWYNCYYHTQALCHHLTQTWKPFL